MYSAYVYFGVVRKMRALVALAAVEGHSANEKSHNVWSMKVSGIEWWWWWWWWWWYWCSVQFGFTHKVLCWWCVVCRQFYPLVMIICFFWATCNRLYQTFGGGLVFWLNGLHVFFAASQGLGNVIVYMNTAQVQQRLRLAFYGKSYCPCVQLKPEDSQAMDGVVVANTSGAAAEVHGPGAASAMAAASAAAVQSEDGASGGVERFRDFDAKRSAPGGVVGSSAEAEDSSAGAGPRSFGFRSVDDPQAEMGREHDAPQPEPIVPAAPTTYETDFVDTPSSKRQPNNSQPEPDE